MNNVNVKTTYLEEMDAHIGALTTVLKSKDVLILAKIRVTDDAPHRLPIDWTCWRREYPHEITHHLDSIIISFSTFSRLLL